MDISNNFNYHKPSKEKVEIHEAVRAASKSLAELIDDIIPESREKSLSITKLEESLMWANAAIARNSFR